MLACTGRSRAAVNVPASGEPVREYAEHFGGTSTAHNSVMSAERRHAWYGLRLDGRGDPHGDGDVNRRGRCRILAVRWSGNASRGCLLSPGGGTQDLKVGIQNFKRHSKITVLYLLLTYMHLATSLNTID